MTTVFDHSIRIPSVGLSGGGWTIGAVRRQMLAKDTPRG